MKRKLNLIILSLVFFAAGTLFTGCEDNGGTFTADEARAELIQAGEEIMYNMGMMMQTPAMETMVFFMGLMDVEFEPMASTNALFTKKGKTYIPGFGMASELVSTLGTLTYSKQMGGGVFQFNFNTGQFDLIDDNVNYIEFIFPANYEALSAGQNNASLRLQDLVIIEVPVDGYTEMLPVSANIVLRINQQQVMNLSFQANYNQEGLPVSVALDLQMSPYMFNVNYTGSNGSYIATASLKEGSKTLMQNNLTLTYTQSGDDLESVNGSIQITPLLFTGSMEVLAMDNCNENIDCMNDNMDIEVRQSAKNMKIGMLEYRMYNDPGWGNYPELAVVYADGTYDFLADLFDIEL